MLSPFLFRGYAMPKFNIKKIFTLAGLLTFNVANADVYINATRVIYPAEKHEITFTVGNGATTKSLIQTWVDEGNSKETPDNTKAPFILTPPLATIGPQRTQNIRMSYSGEQALPDDKESLFWINVLEAPKNTQDPNELRISLRTRIKLFYRPAKLELKPEDAAKKIEWQINQSEGKWILSAQNNSPYFITLSQIKIKTDQFTGQAKLTPQNSMISPKGNIKLLLTPEKTPTESGIKFSTINDYGGTSDYTATLK
ncbi:fimbria/pilus periplasmic chaperone [Aquitalea sp.]|uniref:fimbrial biogenesis chaperone n=1 Tax=Aquitalea sp. TaxID=1872623 RepID=UPI00258B0F43|nr:fimbria/pilus periplasmic chaperone [Aquitalea sp.]